MNSQSDDPYKERDNHLLNELRESGKAFIRSMLTHPNVKEAARLVEDHAGKSFDRLCAAEEEQSKRMAEIGEEQAKMIKEELRALEHQRLATKPFLTVAGHKGGDAQGRPVLEWTLTERLGVGVAVIFMALVLAAGAGNCFSAIMATGIPVFLDYPFLAILLSCLLPSGSIALHCFVDILGSDRSREFYTKLIFGLTFVFLFTWVITFGLNFQIANEGVNLDTLGKPVGSTAVIFTIVQLLAELFTGTSLALIATHIYRRHTKDITIPNPEAERLDECIAQARSRYASLEPYQRAWERLIQLKAMKALYISEQVAQFLALRRCFDDSNPTIS